MTNPSHFAAPPPPAQPRKPDGPPRLLVTAGPTAEDIDAVRYVTNRSTGKMGVALARAARARGWPVRLVYGPAPLAPPEEDARLTVARVRSAADMAAAVRDALGGVDALAMAAAVADYTPAAPFAGKMKKADGERTLTFRRTVDILEMVRDHPARRAARGRGHATDVAGADGARPLRAVLGFSLGVDPDEAEGRRKLARKDLDGIVVNTTASFGAETETACLLRRDGSARDFGVVDKDALAAALLDEIAAWLDA